MMIFCVLRLGRYVARVPHAVVSGFSCGVGAMMIILQLGTLLGLPASPSAVSASPLGQFGQVLSNLRHTRWEPLLLGAIVVAGAIAAARRWPRSPAALVGVGLAVAAGYAARGRTSACWETSPSRCHRLPASPGRPMTSPTSCRPPWGWRSSRP